MLKRMDGSRALDMRRKPRAGFKSELSNAGGGAQKSSGPDLSDLSDALGYLLRRAQLASFKSFKETFKRTNITPAQFSVLTIIDRSPGLKQNQLSDALGIKRANFVSLIDALEARGLAERAPAADRRSYALQLTPRGKKLVKQLRALSAEQDAKIGAAIGPVGQDTLRQLLKAVIAHLEGLPEETSAAARHGR